MSSMVPSDLVHVTEFEGDTVGARTPESVV